MSLLAPTDPPIYFSRKIDMYGECLCGRISFQVTGSLRDLYQCHCSLCRKVTGAAANAATFVPGDQFRWLSGADGIRTFQKPSGYRSDFCGECGSPVPNPLRETGLVWIPAGLLEGVSETRVKVHLHMNSSAKWERDSEHCVRLEEGAESLASLYAMLGE